METKKTITVEFDDLEERLLMTDQLKRTGSDSTSETELCSVEACKILLTRAMISLAESYKKHGCKADYGYIGSEEVSTFLLIETHGQCYGDVEAGFIFRMGGIHDVKIDAVGRGKGEKFKKESYQKEPEQALDDITLKDEKVYLKYKFTKDTPEDK